MKSNFEVGKWYWCTTPPSLGLPSKLGFLFAHTNENDRVAVMWNMNHGVYPSGNIRDKEIAAKDENGNAFHFLSHHVYYPGRKGLDRFGVER